MKLAVIGPLPPLRGGISHYNTSLIAALRDAGHQVLPFGFKRLYPRILFPGTSEFDHTLEPVEGAQSILTAWNPLAWRQVIRHIRAAKPDRLVVHHWHPFFVPVLRSVSSAIPRGGLVVIAHNVIPHEHQRAGFLLNRWLFAAAGLVIVGATREREKLNRIVPDARAKIVPHPLYDMFSAEEYLCGRMEARQRLGWDRDRPYILHAGLVRRYKGVDILLRATAQMKTPGLKLEVAGEFYDDFSFYDSLLEQLGVSDRVTLTNRYLSQEEMSLHLQAADVVVLPYRHATQSGIAMAALACGTAVIATRVGALPDVIDDRIFGELVEPDNPGELAKAVDRFLEVPGEKREEQREEIARRARERFSWRKLVDAVVGEVRGMPLSRSRKGMQPISRIRKGMEED